MKLDSKFTPEDDKYILKHYRPGKICGAKVPGLSTKDIAQVLNHPRASVITRYHVLMRHRNRGTKPDYTKIADRGEEKEDYRIPSMPVLRCARDLGNDPD